MLFVYDRKKVSIIAHLLLTIFIITFSMINCISCSNARNNLAFTESIELSVSTEFIENSVEVLTNVTDETIVSTTTTEETVISNIIQTESTEDFSVMSFENNNDPKNIVNIYIYHSAWGKLYREYIIDFENKKFWKYYGDFTESQMRDHSAENEGFAFGKDLEDTDIAVFTDESIKYGFLVWDKQYHDEMVVDGTSRSITITFSDGSQKETSIYAEKKDYPKTWDEMREAFINLTGEDVLWQ